MAEISDEDRRKKIKDALDGKGQEMELASQAYLKELEGILELFPGEPSFIGKQLEYPKIKKEGILKRKKRAPGIIQMIQLREEVHKFFENKGVINVRGQLQGLLKEFPDNPDIRALNAIQTYNDTLQSGLDEKKILVIQHALKEVALALHNGGLTIFNATWFIRIYLKYIETLNVKYKRHFATTVRHYNKKIQDISKDIHGRQMCMMAMYQLKENLGNLSLLNTRLHGSSFITEALTDLELEKAANAFQNGDEEKKVSGNKKANHIIFVTMTLCLIFAKIPILKNLIKDTLKKIKDTSRDLILQKKMILNAQRVSEYQFAIARGDQKAASHIATIIYEKSLNTIKEYLENAILYKNFEVDPFIKAAWIAKDSHQLFTETTVKQHLEKGKELLDIVLGERCQFKGSYEAAKNLQAEILYLMTMPEEMQRY
ncbi:MAG: hypothetical protein HOD92_11930 [Deltaproteobacteria bacterium]|jgi:hypothetical protein|nr:hypothetical protein [Deltaproteobacteria bacterium]MBT4527612.1 hypothetical protein [Deltaproteobacteria bacterium]